MIFKGRRAFCKTGVQRGAFTLLEPGLRVWEFYCQMRIFDVPKGYCGIERPLRVGVHGTCRVHDPFEALAAAGNLITAWANDPSVSHTLGETRQALRHSLGIEVVPDSLLPFVFDEPDGLPRWEPKHRRTLESVDAFVIEVSELRQVRYRTFFFQIQAFVRNFVSRHGTSLLPWFTAFSSGKSIPEELVQQTLSNLSRDEGDRRQIESILREAQLETLTAETARQAIDDMRRGFAARWLLVSHFSVPGDTGQLMRDRRQLSDTLRQAAEMCGVGFFDPTGLVRQYGRAAVLAKGGADIYHYDQGFNITVGESLIRSLQPEIRISGDMSPMSASVKDTASIGAASRSLNAELVAFHRERLAQSNIDDSGLHAHYALLLDRNEIIGKYQSYVVDVVIRCLPEFDHYDVPLAGLGEIAFLLAALGRRATAFEYFSTRFAAMTAGARYLQSIGLLPEGGIRAVEAMLPAGGNRKRTLAVATQLALTVLPEEEERILRRLETYEALLFCPSLLVRERSEPEQEALLERFRAAGFVIVRDYPQQNLTYCAKSNAEINAMVVAPKNRKPAFLARLFAR